MKRILLLVPLAAALAGCVDRREVCAQYAASLNDGTHWDEIKGTYKKLGIRGDAEKQGDAHQAIENYCAFYKG